ncbi:uncharacterized protein LOC126847733 [Adelges cooleyi]|uniref:uncharacterized protein LOC126847733 n=1 Tax=Adelges cooleyi TaxID=133065 RepID=UPI0021804649|nr:uncharacterized protein LOC126847733 [Adelges cooleyi]
MHFKCALVFCALYFLTSAWSTGLNSYQLETLQNLYKPYKTTRNGVKEETIRPVVENIFGMEWEDPDSEFGFYLDESDSMHLFNLLRMMAFNEIKHTDQIQVKKLTLSEVQFYLDEFEKRFEFYKQDGYLNLQQLSQVFVNWKTVNDALNERKKQLEIENKKDYVMNAADFLLTIIEIKPKGLGLTLAQIKMFIDLYDAHKTSDGINAAASRGVFQELGIQIDDVLEKRFKSERTAEILLKDLIIVAAERNMTVPKNERRALRVSEVVSVVQYFNVLDINKDGLLSSDEYMEDLKGDFEDALVSIKESPEAIERAQHYINVIFKGNKTINVAEYTELMLFMMDLEELIEPDDAN